MRRALIFAVMLIGLMSPSAATANDSVDAAIKGLRSSNVYVAPNTPGTNSDTSVTLKQALREGDHIALVMLPPGSTTAADAAARIDKATKHSLVLGVSVGDDFRGYSKLLPEDTAIDQMNRAKSIASSPVETLTTFAQLARAWQQANPKEVKKPAKPKTESGNSNWLLLFLIIPVFGAGMAIWLALGLRPAGSSDDHPEFNAPNAVRNELEKIYGYRAQIADPHIKEVVGTICSDTEAFFERSEGSDRNTSTEAVQFAGPLSSVTAVLERYIDIQDHPRFYRDSEQLLEAGEEAIEAFASFVLDSIQDNSSAALINFKVDAKIIGATRYR